jgi:hypothetical protein
MIKYRVSPNELTIGSCYIINNQLPDASGGPDSVLPRYLGRLTHIDAAISVPEASTSFAPSGMDESKRFRFEHGTAILGKYHVTQTFDQVECRASDNRPGGGGAGAAPAGAAKGGSGGASNASSAKAPAPTPASEKLKQNLQSTVLPDGTRFIVGREFLSASDPYFTVTIRPPGESPRDAVYKIVLRDLSIGNFFGMPDATPERFAFLEAIVSPFRPSANNASRPSARKQRKSRRTNRKRGTRQRK